MPINEHKHYIIRNRLEDCKHFGYFCAGFIGFFAYAITYENTLYVFEIGANYMITYSNTSPLLKSTGGKRIQNTTMTTANKASTVKSVFSKTSFFLVLGSGRDMTLLTLTGLQA